MPGCRLWGGDGGHTIAPNTQALYLANSLNGTGTPPAAGVYSGDLAVLTTKASLTANGVAVARMLLQADITALYQEGGSIAGIYGMFSDDCITNSSGVAQPPPTTIGGTSFPGSYAQNQLLDPVVLRSQGRVQAFQIGINYAMPIYTGGGSVTVAGQYNDTLAGFHISVTAGVTTYTIDPAATTKCIKIMFANTADPTYGNLVAQNGTGTELVFQVLPAYCQQTSGVNYSTN